MDTVMDMDTVWKLKINLGKINFLREDRVL